MTNTKKNKQYTKKRKINKNTTLKNKDKKNTKFGIVYDIMKLILELQLRHWNTNIYTEHKIIDKFMIDIKLLMDKYVENSLNINNNYIQFDTFKLKNINSKNDTIEKIKKLERKLKIMTNIDDQQKVIIDDMIILCNKTIYLLNLN